MESSAQGAQSCGGIGRARHGMRIFKPIHNAAVGSFAMIASSTGCLQAVCNECEFVGNEREQSARLMCNESELKNALFASRGDYVCKLLQVPHVFCLRFT